MSLLPSEFEQIFCMNVVRNCLCLPPTKFHVIWPSRTPDIGKIISSIWARLQDRFWLLFCGQTLNLKTADLGLTLFMNIVGLFLSFPSIYIKLKSRIYSSRYDPITEQCSNLNWIGISFLSLAVSLSFHFQ